MLLMFLSNRRGSLKKRKRKVMNVWYFQPKGRRHVRTVLMELFFFLLCNRADKRHVVMMLKVCCLCSTGVEAEG